MHSIQFQNLTTLAEKTDSLGRPGIQRALKLLSTVWDRDLADDLEQYLLCKSYPHIQDPFYKYGPVTGDFNLGQNHYFNFGLTGDRLTQGVLIVGRSGSGKTTLLYNLISECIGQGIPFLAFDFKRDYRHLIRKFPGITVIPWRKLKFNPLHPPEGVNTKHWMQVFCEVFGHAHALLSASKNFLLGQLHKLYDLYGVFDIENGYPSFHELAELLNALKPRAYSKDSTYLQTVRNRVNATLLSMGDMLDCEQGYPLEVLLNRNVVLELDGMMDDCQNWLVEIILAWIYHYRLAQNHRGELRHVVLFDEAKRIFDANKERIPESGIPIINLITDRCREFGEALVVADQEPNKLTASIKSNSCTKVMMSLVNGNDIASMARNMGLSQEQVAYSHGLKVGEGIVKVAGHNPFPIQVPKVELKKDVPDSDLPSIPFTHIPRIRAEEFTHHLRELRGEKPDEYRDELSKEAETLFLDIIKNPFRQVSERYRALGLSAYKGNKAKSELLGKKYLKEIEIETGKRGGRTKVYDVTEKGKEHATKQGINISGEGKGGLEHRYWQKSIKESLEGWGCKAEIEKYIGKKSIDVVARCPSGRWIAVEIAMTPRYEVENIRKDLEFGFHRLVVACKDKETRESVEKKVKREFGEKLPETIRFCLVTDFNGRYRPKGI